MPGPHRKPLTAEAPPSVVELLRRVPACFSAHSWASYLDDCWRRSQNAREERERVERGELPDFCIGCTRDYQARMQAQGRCHPPYPVVSSMPQGADSPPAAPAAGGLLDSREGPPQGVAGSMHNRIEPAAAVAGKKSVGLGVAGVKDLAPAPSCSLPTEGKSQPVCPSQAARPHRRSPGLCAEAV